MVEKYSEQMEKQNGLRDKLEESKVIEANAAIEVKRKEKKLDEVTKDFEDLKRQHRKLKTTIDEKEKEVSKSKSKLEKKV